MRKQLQFFTDRCWIPMWLTNGKIKWVLWLIGLVMAIFLILSLAGIAIGQEFPYKDWNIVQVIRMPNGIWSIFLQNPKDKTEMIMIVLTPIDILFFKQPLPEVRSFKGLGDCLIKNRPLI